MTIEFGPEPEPDFPADSFPGRDFQIEVPAELQGYIAFESRLPDDVFERVNTLVLDTDGVKVLKGPESDVLADSWHVQSIFLSLHQMLEQEPGEFTSATKQRGGIGRSDLAAQLSAEWVQAEYYRTPDLGGHYGKNYYVIVEKMLEKLGVQETAQAMWSFKRALFEVAAKFQSGALLPDVSVPPVPGVATLLERWTAIHPDKPVIAVSASPTGMVKALLVRANLSQFFQAKGSQVWGCEKLALLGIEKDDPSAWVHMLGAERHPFLMAEDSLLGFTGGILAGARYVVGLEPKLSEAFTEGDLFERLKEHVKRKPLPKEPTSIVISPISFDWTPVLPASLQAA